MKLSTCVTIVLVILAACLPGLSDILIFHGNGTGPLEDKEKQAVIDAGTYYSISAESSVFQKGDFFFKGEKAGSLEFDSEGNLIRQTIWTSHFNLPKEETVIEYEYEGSLLAHTTKRLNGHLIQAVKIKYDDQEVIARAVFQNWSLSMGNDNDLRSGDETLMVCEYKVGEQTLTRTYSFPESPGRLTEKLHYQPSSTVPGKGFIDPETNFDQKYYSVRGLAVAGREYFLGGEDITGDTQTRNLFFINKGEVTLPSIHE